MSSGRKASNHQIYFQKIYYLHIPFTCEFNHLSWLPDDLVHQPPLEEKKKALMLFLLEVPNATDVSWNEEFEFPVTPVSRLSRGEVKLGNPETLKSFAVFGNI